MTKKELEALNAELALKLKAAIARGNGLAKIVSTLQATQPQRKRVEISRTEENGTTEWLVWNNRQISGRYPDFASASSKAKELATAH